VDLPVLAGFGADGSPSIQVAERAARAWLAGGVVGLPTETVYGLAADAQDARAVGRVYAAKGRPPDHPLIVHVAGADALDGWSAARSEVAHRLADVFWPGPLTLIVQRSHRAGDFITGGQATVALRCPDHPVALACLAALAIESGDPARGVAAPSANRFGRISPTRAPDVVAELGDRLDPARDLVVDGGACAVGVESTIVDCTADPPRVLRLGAISQAEIDSALARGHVPGPSASDGAPPTAGPAAVRAPGTLESHYAPTARVVLVERPSDSRPPAATRAPNPPARDPAMGDPRTRGSDPFGLRALETAQPEWITGSGGAAAGGVGLVAESDVPTPDGWTRLAAPATAEDYARDLYAALRRADERGLGTVVAVLPDPEGGPLAHAVRDRLARAAHGD
jgi:L-threonylcarbamoyladenylate synthase